MGIIVYCILSTIKQFIETTMENRTLGRQAYEYLKRRILSNEFKPGERLREVELAKSLMISRAPVREALQALAVEGMVTINPRRGTYVAKLDPQEYLEYVQVREALESLGARLATPKLSQEDLHKLESLNKQMQEEGKRDRFDGFFKLNGKFHALIIEKSNNHYLQEQYAQLIDHLNRYRFKSLILRRGIKHTMAEHQAILAAMKDKNPQEAARLMAQHIHVPAEAIERSDDAWSDFDIESVQNLKS